MHRCPSVTLVTRVKAGQGREAVFLTLHCLLHEDGTGDAGSVRRKEPSSLGRRLQGCSLSLAPCAQGCPFPHPLFPSVQGCSPLVLKIHLQGFFGLRAQRKVGKQKLLLPSLCWGGKFYFAHLFALFKRLFACRCESLWCAKPEGRTHGTGATLHAAAISPDSRPGFNSFDVLCKSSAPRVLGFSAIFLHSHLRVSRS